MKREAMAVELIETLSNLIETEIKRNGLMGNCVSGRLMERGIRLDFDRKFFVPIRIIRSVQRQVNATFASRDLGTVYYFWN